MATTILWKSYRPSTPHKSLEIYDCEFVEIRSMHDGLSGFLEQVGSLTRLLKLYALRKSFIWTPLTPTLKSPIIILLSYWEEYKSKFLLSISMCLEMLFLCGL